MSWHACVPWVHCHRCQWGYSTVRTISFTQMQGTYKHGQVIGLYFEEKAITSVLWQKDVRNVCIVILHFSNASCWCGRKNLPQSPSPNTFEEAKCCRLINTYSLWIVAWLTCFKYHVFLFLCFVVDKIETNTFSRSEYFMLDAKTKLQSWLNIYSSSSSHYCRIKFRTQN